MFRFLSSMKFALHGISYALRTERNVQIWFGTLIATLIVAAVLNVSKIEFLIIMIWMFLIGTSELLNTAIEALADRVTTDYDEIIKRVKDIAAGATFITSTGAFISCLVIFIPKIIEMISE